MRIGVDAHVLAGIPQGSRTYVAELYRKVLEKDTENEYVFFGHWEDSKPFGDRVEYVSFSSRTRFKRLTLESGRLIKKHGIELYHTQYISPLWLPVPSLVTIHDVFPDSHPQFFGWRQILRSKIMYRLSAWRAVQIHTVSRYSGNEIVARYGVMPEKVHLVPNGVDTSRFRQIHVDSARDFVADQFDAENFVLSVGRLEPRKNYPGIIRAYAQARGQRSDIGPLVIVGYPDYGYKEIFKTIADADLGTSVKILTDIKNDDLRKLYCAARLFVYPSFAEGFGIPPLEAMAAGTPTIVSNCTALPEVTGNAALQVSPFNDDELADSILSVFANPQLEASLIDKGRAVAGSWTWSRAADQYLTALDRVKL